MMLKRMSLCHLMGTSQPLTKKKKPHPTRWQGHGLQSSPRSRPLLTSFLLLSSSLRLSLPPSLSSCSFWLFHGPAFCLVLICSSIGALGCSFLRFHPLKKSLLRVAEGQICILATWCRFDPQARQRAFKQEPTSWDQFVLSSEFLRCVCPP